MKPNAPNGGKSTATAPKASHDKTVVRVECTTQHCTHSTDHTADTRTTALARATMDCATHEHRTRRSIEGEPVTTLTTITGPDATDIHVSEVPADD